MKLSFLEIAKRITGISTPVVGVSWNPPVLEVDVVKKLITLLESRRVLFESYDVERLDYAVQSILEIRERIAHDMEQVDRSSELTLILRDMRETCEEFLSATQSQDIVALAKAKRYTTARERGRFFSELSKLRRNLAVRISQLSVRYGIDLEAVFGEEISRLAERGTK